MRSFLILAVFLVQLVRINQSDFMQDTRPWWYFYCSEEQQQELAIELPRLLNIERGKLARGERSYISDSGDDVKYAPATNMREVKWSPDILSIAKLDIEKYLKRNNFEDYELSNIFNQSSPNNATLYYSAKLTEDPKNCKEAWIDYAESNNETKINATGLVHGNTTIYEDEVRLESLKSLAVVSEIGCHQMGFRKKNKIVTICMHAVYDEQPDFEIEEDYEEGEACSNCPDGTGCNSLKLCSVDSPPMSTTTTTEKTTTTTVTTTTTKVTSTKGVVSTSPPPKTTTIEPTATTTQATTTQAPVQASAQTVESQPLKAETEEVEEYEDCDDASWPTEFNKVFLAGFIIYYYFYYNYYYYW